ncbi:DUF637 domain-containing protein, partial [Photorhabdus khanii]
AGAGITASVAGSAAGTAGSAATAAGATASTAATVGSMAYGATASGMAALASQAAVALVDNQGDLSKTLKAMGSSDTVKSTFTSMAMGGALAGFDNIMGWDNAANGAKLDPLKAKLPSLSNGDWSKVAQRVAGQSIIGASLGTTINGGSFKDNFTTALLSNIGSQINAEGANLIGNNGQVLGVPGKAISHAAVSALAAEIGGGNAKGAAAGALAAELAAIMLDRTFSDPMSIQAGGKIIGGVAGAIATNSAEGANSGAHAGEVVIVYNSLAHLLSAAEKERRGTIKAYEEKKKAFCQQSPEACKQAGETISFGTDFVPVVGDIKSFVEARSAIDYLAAAVGIIPGIGDAASKSIKTAEKALAKGDISEASRLINKASDEISSVKVLDVGSYKELKAREIVGDGLEHDHIPSYSALRTAKEKELGRKLTPEEDKALYKNSTAVEVPKDVHAAGPTYRGKNTREQVNQDAMDLCGATCRDTDALRNNMLERGYDPKQVDDAIKQIKERNRQMGVIK